MYQIEYGGYEVPEQFVIDTLDLSELPIRTSSQNITGANGGVIWNQLYGFRTITIGGSMYGDSGDEYYNLRRAFTSAFSIARDSNNLLTTKELKITLSNGDIRYADCKVMSLPDYMETAGQKFLARFQTVVQSENPFLRSSKETVEIDGAIIGGFPVATPVPTPLGGIPVNSQTITVTGDYGSYPEYLINSTITNPRITNQTTGESWGLDMTVNGSTGAIPVKFVNGKLTVGSNNEYVENFVGNMFRLQPGANTIVFSGADNSGSSVELTWWNEYIDV